MEHYKISNLLKDSKVSKTVTKNELKQIIYQAINILPTKILGLKLMLRSDLCDYSDAYVVVKWKNTCYRHWCWQKK